MIYLRSSIKAPTIKAAAVLSVTLLASVAFFIQGDFATKAYAATDTTKSIVSTADTRIVEDTPTTNYGRATTLGIDGDDPDGSGKDKSGLIRWDLSDVPTGSKINSASVTVNVTDASVNTYQAYALERGWTEAGATWNFFAADSPWEVAGAKGSLDREATVAGTISPSKTGKQTFAISPEVVQRWVENPAANQGLVIANATNKDGFAFNSRDYSDATLRPQLTITFAPVDNTPPETAIDSGPAGTVNSSSASFSFSSSEPNSTFECQLDGAPFGACSSPKDYTGLSDGEHTFGVRATDAAGNTDSTPANRTWRVLTEVDDESPASPVITEPLDNSYNNTGNITVSGTAEAESTIELFDGTTSGGTTQANAKGEWTKVLSGVAEGSHTYTAKATDAAGNESEPSSAVTVTVDTEAPSVPVIGSPADGTITNDSIPTFSGTTEASSMVELFDGGTPLGKVTADGSGDWSFIPSSALGDGNHSMTAKATDAAGNTSSASATVSVTIDTLSPETTIDSGPSGSTSDTTAAFSFSSEANATFECKLDGNTFERCASPKIYSGLADGSHSFEVRATDVAGNTDTTPARRTWTVGTTPSKSILVAVGDTTIAERSPNKNYGGVTSIGADGDVPDGSGQDESALIRWNLSSIAPGTSVETASVTLNVTNSSVHTYKAYALKRAWTEAAATWKLYAAGSQWQIAGARGQLDRAAEVAGTIWPATTGKLTFALSPEVVQRWVDNPAAYQGIIIADETNTDGFDFDSRENSDASLRPQLTITWRTTPTQSDAVLVGAGDIHASCSKNTDEATADLLDGIAGTVFTLGDNVDSGTAAEYNNCYGSSWGRHKPRTLPGIGNHEYDTGTASGYFGYFGEAAGDPTKGYYSYDRGEWHVVVLNSMCEKVGGCGASSPMLTWLRNDLAASPTKCTVAAWHHPLFSSGGATGSLTKMKPAYRLLYDNHADVVLSAHDRIYERFAPQDPDGVADPKRGIREFVVGTGGGTLHALGTVQPNSEVRNNETYGVLKLTLRSGSYDWTFTPVAGKTFTDSGSTNCH